MVKSKSIQKGTIQFTCSNGVTAFFLTAFKNIKTFYDEKPIEELSSEGMTVSELCDKLENYSL